MSERNGTNERNFIEEESHRLRFEILLEAARSSAKRVRLLLIIMVTASILAMGSLWNSQAFSWQRLRINRLAYLIQHLGRLEKELKNTLLTKNNNYNLDPHNKEMAKIHISDVLYIDENRKTGLLLDYLPLKDLSETEKDDLFFNFHCCSNALESDSDYGIFFDLYLKNKKITTLKIETNKADYLLFNNYKNFLFLGTQSLCTYFSKVISQKKEYLSFNIPFFEINFDINDLGFVGGMGFSLILVILYISLIKEYANTRIAFETSAREFKNHLGKRRDLYYFMSMSQLFSTIPAYEHKKLISITRLIFLGSPGLFSLLILINDINTFGNGILLDPDKGITLFELLSNGLFFLFILLVSYKCLKKMKNIDSLWKEEHDKIKIKESEEKKED